jgi:hypothetical protein
MQLQVEIACECPYISADDDCKYTGIGLEEIRSSFADVISLSCERSAERWETLIHPEARITMTDYFRDEIPGYGQLMCKRYPSEQSGAPKDHLNEVL